MFSKNIYHRRQDSLEELGYTNYVKYLTSDTWLHFVKNNIEGQRCFCCNKPAYTFHHQDYNIDTLSRPSLRKKNLIPICKSCHYEIEFRPDGTKRTDSSELRKARREIQIRNGCTPKNICLVCAIHPCIKGARGRSNRMCRACKRRHNNTLIIIPEDQRQRREIIKSGRSILQPRRKCSHGKNKPLYDKWANLPKKSTIPLVGGAISKSVRLVGV